MAISYLKMRTLIILTTSVFILNACGGSSTNTNNAINATLQQFPSTKVTTATKVPLATEPQKAPDLSQVYFAFENAYKKLWSKSFSNNYTISGTCNGRATFIAGNISSNTFEGITGFVRKNINTFSLANCEPANTMQTETIYLDVNYFPIAKLGDVNTNNEYIVFSKAPILPKDIKIGDSGDFVSYNHYTDNAKTTQTAYTKISYVAEKDNLSIQGLPTIIIKTISKTYSMQNQEMYSHEITYRITQSAILNIVRMTYKNNTNNRILVLTKE